MVLSEKEAIFLRYSIDKTIAKIKFQSEYLDMAIDNKYIYYDAYCNVFIEANPEVVLRHLYLDQPGLIELGEL